MKQSSAIALAALSPVQCTGLYADVEYKTNKDMKQGKDWQKYSHLLQQYERYRRSYARNIKFDIDNEDLSKY